ncbi:MULTISPECIES: LysR family transcriptional regulator [unclassified Pseudomonas]|uniref:LysR family transcriptional regulator n=1 Tax=unclassified Pseudomonas TaxID=196821 RepID=UPI0008774531|nr:MULTISPECIES: LysR family transcriptional regulator [unclassified Pseudomonas]SCZ39771.1 DNA-binding transcriptional regulator, LysR family [Pseudomonas sp. NFACC44-2]SDA89618.1 DNA-binding transcriptional regulator, LysR family [Pseudomonas sp. NFACC51]SDW44786.1 DNA-binding transcriptional regulator, LysR family [Pseudomonas sp. NFACC08-1]SFI14792.1 DNA-binding transcriptional regulator, LysR family [Pseudomonas sp. NFACC54]SFT28221.1 DNA-binding transcriptional regulator, LysR family [Ps
MDIIGDLEVFTLVADTRSFSAAGRSLNLAPSSVSRVVDRLEARLNVRLLLRTTRALTLTAEGATYLSSARRILADLKETEQLIADRSSPRGRLRISASILYGKTFLLPLLKEFTHRYPDILVDINLTDTVVDISAGQADVALRLGPLADAPLVARRLWKTRKVIVASRDYLAARGTPQVPEDLHDHDCIDFNFKRAAPGWPFIKDGNEYALKIKGSIETNNGDTQGQLALEGLGIARVCAETVQQAIEAGQLVPLLEAFNPGDGEEVHVVFMGGPHLPARVRCFVDYLVKSLGEGLLRV